jgi:hypothetical protein
MGLQSSVRIAEKVFKQHDFSRSHQLRLFDMNNVPDYVTNQFIDQEGRVYITSASVPGVKFNDIAVNFQAFPFHIPGQMEFDGTWTLNIKTPGDYLVRGAMERWMFSIQNPDTSCGAFQFPCPDTSIDLAVVAPDCSVVRGYRLIGVYPQSVGPIAYNQEEVNVTNFDVTFMYQRWIPLEINDSDTPYASNVDSVFQSFESKIAAGVGAPCSIKK